MRPTAFPASVQTMIDHAIPSLGADPIDLQLYKDLVDFDMQLSHDNLNLADKATRKFVAGNLAMCMGDYEDVAVNFRETVKQAYNAILTHKALKGHHKALWRSMVQQICSEHRASCKRELIWVWEL